MWPAGGLLPLYCFLLLPSPQRLCKEGLAWSNGDQYNPHGWSECSNRGVCDRTAGECQCFSGVSIRFPAVACRALPPHIAPLPFSSPTV